MSYRIKRGIKVHPDCKSLIGKDCQSAHDSICEVWDNPLKTESAGRNGYKCIEYNKDRERIIIFVDENEMVLDVFSYELACQPVEWC